MNTPPTGLSRALLIGLPLGLVAALGFWAVLSYQPVRPDDLDEQFRYDETKHDSPGSQPALRWEEMRTIPSPMQTPRGIAVRDNRLAWLVGDGGLVGRTGEPIRQGRQVDLRCVTISPDGSVFVADENSLYRFVPDDKLVPVLDLPERALPSSLAATARFLFLADAGNKVVWRCTHKGKNLTKLGGKSERTEAPGFVVPSGNFDLLVGPAGLLRVVNPGNQRVEAYTLDGYYEAPLAWGTSGTRLEDFTGCCNPSDLALLPDGRFVTAEKGTPRVKVYDEKGNFLSLVAGPMEFTGDAPVADLATDSTGRIYVLDAVRNTIRIFEERKR